MPIHKSVENRLFKHLFSILFVLLTPGVSEAASASPGSLLTYEGILTDSGGTPISTTTTATFQILYGTCILYQEQQTLTPGTNGEFSVIVGTGTRTDSTNNTAQKIFVASGSVNCEGSSATTITGFSLRTLHINVGGTDLTPDVTIGNIPVAINAMRLADKEATDFLLKAGLPTCATGTYLTYDGTNLSCVAAAATTGITSLNGQTGTTQTFATPGTTGASPAWTSTGNTHTLNIPLASASGVTAGLLSKTDYDAFSAKQSSGNYVTALTGDVTATGPGSVAATIASGVVTTAKIASGTIVSSNMNFTGSNLATSSLVLKDSTGKFAEFACSTIGQVATWTAVGWGCAANNSFVNGGNSFGAAAVLGTNDSNSLTINTAGTARMTFLASGKIGIGQTTPTYPLEVNGTGAAGDYTTSTISTDGNLRLGGFDYTGATGRGIIMAKVYDGTNAHKGYIYFASPSGNGASVTMRTADQTMSGSMQLINTDGRLSFQTGGTERMTIANSGVITTSNAVVGTPTTVAAATVDLSTSNTQVLSSVGGSAITLSNMANGGNYTLVIQDTTSRTYTFSGCNTSKFLPPNAATVSGTWSTYNILTLYNGTTYDCVITWATGYQ